MRAFLLGQHGHSLVSAVSGAHKRHFVSQDTPAAAQATFAGVSVAKRAAWCRAHLPDYIQLHRTPKGSERAVTSLSVVVVLKLSACLPGCTQRWTWLRRWMTRALILGDLSGLPHGRGPFARRWHQQLGDRPMQNRWLHTCMCPLAAVPGFCSVAVKVLLVATQESMSIWLARGTARTHLP